MKTQTDSNSGSILGILALFGFFTVTTGILYPLLITGIGQAGFSRQANGSLIVRDGKTVGSELIAQKFENPGNFWPRPSAVDYNPMPSGGSNLGPTSAALKTAIAERLAKGMTDDLLFASASGLDPEISPAAAYAQLPRIAKSRKLDAAQTETFMRNAEDLLKSQVQDRQWGFLGEARVNVLKLNLALQKL